jgi:hypothetical protein
MIDLNHRVFTPSDSLYFVIDIDGDPVIKEAHVMQIDTKDYKPSSVNLDYKYKIVSDGTFISPWISHQEVCEQYSLDRKSAIHSFVLLQEVEKIKLQEEYEFRLELIDKYLAKAKDLEAIENGEAPLF